MIICYSLAALATLVTVFVLFRVWRQTPRSDPLDRRYGPERGSGPEVLADRNVRTCSRKYRPGCRSANIRPAIETLTNTAELAQHRLLVEDNTVMPSWGVYSA